VEGVSKVKRKNRKWGREGGTGSVKINHNSEARQARGMDWERGDFIYQTTKREGEEFHQKASGDYEIRLSWLHPCSYLIPHVSG